MSIFDTVRAKVSAPALKTGADVTAKKPPTAPKPAGIVPSPQPSVGDKVTPEVAGLAAPKTTKPKVTMAEAKEMANDGAGDFRMPAQKRIGYSASNAASDPPETAQSKLAQANLAIQRIDGRIRKLDAAIALAEKNNDPDLASKLETQRAMLQHERSELTTMASAYRSEARFHASGLPEVLGTKVQGQPTNQEIAARKGNAAASARHETLKPIRAKLASIEARLETAGPLERIALKAELAAEKEKFDKVRVSSGPMIEGVPGEAEDASVSLKIKDLEKRLAA